MSALPGKEIWQKIHSRSYSYLDNCWETCNSFCCCNKDPRVSFKAIPKNQQSFPMLKGEFEYLKELNRLQPGMESSYRAISVDLDNGQSAEVYMATCKEAGQCFYPETKPLICKIYPFIPIPDDVGNVVDFEVGSVFDIMFRHGGVPSPCTVLESDNQLVKETVVDQLKDIFSLPYFIFYFQAFHKIAGLFREGLSTLYPPPVEMSSVEFFKAFEMAYMTGKLIDKGQLKTTLKEIYVRLEKKYGTFSV